MEQKQHAKILFFDIETTNLNADFGYVLCAAWKWQGNPTIHDAIISDSPDFKRDPTNDRYVVGEVLKAVESADLIVTWYGIKFDVPFVNSKLLAHGMRVLPPVPHVDGWRIAKYKLKLHSNRLASVSAFLGLEDKTPLNGRIWIRAMAGICKDIRYVVKHCRQDVLVLEQAYNKVRALTTTHPNVGLTSPYTVHKLCPVCGNAFALQKRGMRIARTCIYQRYWCGLCGAWSQGKGENMHLEVR